MEWNDSHKNPPKVNQKVYYFGPNIGLWTGVYKYKEEIIENQNRDVHLCPHLFFCDDGFGLCDACDAPFWLEYDEEREKKGWRPIVPEKFTKDLY